MLMLIRHAEQMALVVEMHITFGLNQKKAVYRAAFRLDSSAARDQGVGLLRLDAHPAYDFFLRQRFICRFHGKSAGKHLGQHDDITSGDGFQLSVKMAQVGRAIHPDQGLLQQSNFQTRHDRGSSLNNILTL